MTARSSTSLHKDTSRGAISGFVAAVGITVFLVGLGIGSYDAARWLQTGRSRPLLVQNAVAGQLPSMIETWITHPHAWLGLHTFIVWVMGVPLFAFVLFLGFLIFIASTA